MAVWTRYGTPPLWQREPGFSTLVYIILEQQVSLASAKAAFERLRAKLGEVTPAAFLTLDDATLKAIGFSRQKTRYGRLLAEELLARRLDLDALTDQPDDVIRERLLKLIGVGPWTVEIYLTMALLRPDAWPVGDIAVAQALKGLYHLDKRPSGETLYNLGECYRPYRAVAARLLWWHYLKGVH
ncbi:MAG: DNA-3-methyladenine glycosylase II [Myxococcota bacterium]|jgi:DNA-3-methyladenine glycosylase II